MSFISARDVKHNFIIRNDEGEAVGEIPALKGIDMEVRAGDFIAVLGQNGSGKSTFAKHLNALLTPTEGTLVVDGKDTADVDKIWDIRQAAGMVFQNPDNQIVAGVVEEDVAFGPENLGVPTEEILNRVDESLASVHMEDYRTDSPNRLSGGQKQRVAVAGVLAMHPKCIIMDEPTAMLDPGGQREVMEAAHGLNREDGVTIILITHDMGEAVGADFIYVLDQGEVVMRGTPGEVFSRPDELENHGMELPQIAKLAARLKGDGYELQGEVLTLEDMVEALCGEGGLLEKGRESDACGKQPVELTDKAQKKPGACGTQSDNPLAGSVSPSQATASGDGSDHAKNMDGKEKLRLENVSYTYTSGGAAIKHALKDINLTVYEGDMLGIIGHTGSGKSTLIQMFDGLMKPDEGKVFYEGKDIRGGGFSLRKLRGKVGLVFQFPEYQLFEMTVLKDAAFGPKNQGFSEEEALEKAREALRQVGLGEDFWEMSPFDLSGGQKRRAAIAGVLAMEPEVLVLDEPGAGMDPRGKKELFTLIRRLHDEMGITVVIVSHSMDDMADFAKRLVVLKDGAIILDGDTREVFSHGDELITASLAVPEMTRLMRELARRGCPVDTAALTVDEAAGEIEKLCLKI